MKYLALPVAFAIAINSPSATADTIEQRQSQNDAATALMNDLLKAPVSALPSDICEKAELYQKQSDGMRAESGAILTSAITMLQQGEPLEVVGDQFAEMGSLLRIKARHDQATGMAVRMCSEFMHDFEN